MTYRQSISNYKGSQFIRQKQDHAPKPAFEEMEETEVSLTDSSFSQKTPISSRRDTTPPSMLATPTNISRASPIDQFKNLLSPSNSIYVNSIKYLKIEQIGSGRYSKVYKVLDPDGNFYALKVVTIINKQSREMYDNEILFLTSFPDSDRIIRLIDYEVADKEIFMVFELGDTDLRRFIDNTGEKQNKRLEPNYLRYLWQQMLYCVQELHSRNVIHGNLRPENFVFIKGSLKLIDFGIVKVIEDDQTSFEDIGIAEFKKNDYRSPEVLSQNKVKWRTSADVWSLGCILYELAYGKYPFPSENYKINYSKIVYSKIQNFPDFRNLQNVIAGCLNKDSKSRPTIDDLLMHPFIQPFGQKTIFDKYEINQASTIESVCQNLKNLAIQVHVHFNDNEFGKEEGRLVRLRLAKDFIQDKQMVILAKSQ
ncbi:hypothetical protein M9Y10_038181 [Tritrichomonas musculus]|uniref:Protein kinase domain-containing protein n=1 Tax=Tritrichomonas musculus TaxID=1915356 RepID=A0ABR2K8F7_9EUKA